ncbi:unnamed protein product, partial [Vitis vinifera]
MTFRNRRRWHLLTHRKVTGETSRTRVQRTYPLGFGFETLTPVAESRNGLGLAGRLPETVVPRWFRNYKFPEFSKEMKRYLAQEKGHGSATDMARRKRVRQTSEREVGMLDMLLITSFAEEVAAIAAVAVEEENIVRVETKRKVERFIARHTAVIWSARVGDLEQYTIK